MAPRSAVSGNTINNLTFSSVTGNYITLSGGALSGNTIDATGASFDGTLAGATAHDAQKFYDRRQNYDADDSRESGFCARRRGTSSSRHGSFNSRSIQRGIDVATVTATASRRYCEH